MHYRANHPTSDVDAYGSCAHSLLAYFEGMDMGEDPVATVLCVVRRVQGKTWDRRAPSKMRRDREYLCFELADGSIFALNPRPERPVVDGYGDPWPWVMIAPNRDGWETLMRQPFSPAELVEDCFCVALEPIAERYVA
jgi:hypothetical protein